MGKNHASQYANFGSLPHTVVLQKNNEHRKKAKCYSKAAFFEMFFHMLKGVSEIEKR